MKKLLLIFCLLPLLTYAQITRVDSTSKAGVRKANLVKYKTQTLYSYSIGIKLFSLEEFPKILNQVSADEYMRQYLSGIILKYNDNQISYRLSGSFYSDDITFKNQCNDCEEAKGKVTDNSLRVGFEKSFIYANFQPYFGFDLGFRRNSFKGAVQNAGNLNFTAPYDVRTQKNGFSLSPLFGLKYNIFSHLSITAESSIDLLYSYEKQERTYNTSQAADFRDFRKWEFLLRPLGLLSLQYNFGENY